MVRIPGTRIRFGLDWILGLLPGFGDLLAAAIGAPIVWVAIRRRYPMKVLAVMLANLALDFVVGSVPLAGNVFDLFWRAHSKNLRLLEDPSAHREIVREAGWKLAVLAAACGVAIALVVALLVLVLWFASRLLPPGTVPGL